MPGHWFAETDICRCGHHRDEHGSDGRCKLYAEAIPIGEHKPGFVQNVRQPGDTCWCCEFNGEPWPWAVWENYSPPFQEPDHWTVQQQGNHDKTHGPYKTAAAAQRRCDELNREMAQGPLDPAFKARRARLVRLAPGGTCYLHEGPPGTQWPICPDRYLVFGFADGWHGDSYVDLYPTLDAVQAALEDPEGNEIDRIVDLDTGADVPFERNISVRIG